MEEKLINELLTKIVDLAPEEAMHFLAERFGNKTIFSTSFGLEDQIIAHLIAHHRIPVTIFTIDTGRLFPQTYSVWNSTISRYQLPVQTFFPRAVAVEKLLNSKGPLSFYESVENRKECCFIRKVEPLKRALKGNQLWITGIRQEQSLNRKEMKSLEWDSENQILKYHPLFNWTKEQVLNYITVNHIPYNPLHDKGYPSIGCQPCTRVVNEGEDERAGRWWWEDNSKKECGLHIGKA